jgi:hypothetical protein
MKLHECVKKTPFVYFLERRLTHGVLLAARFQIMKTEFFNLNE